MIADEATKNKGIVQTGDAIHIVENSMDAIAYTDIELYSNYIGT